MISLPQHARVTFSDRDVDPSLLLGLENAPWAPELLPLPAGDQWLSIVLWSCLASFLFAVISRILPLSDELFISNDLPISSVAELINRSGLHM